MGTGLARGKRADSGCNERGVVCSGNRGAGHSQTADASYCALAVRLPEKYPRDPAGRIIGPTAIVEGMALVTADKQIRQAKVAETIW